MTKLLKSVGVTRKIHLSPKARKLYSIASELKKVAKRLNSENIKNKERLKEAISLAESPNFLWSKVNKRSLNFLLCHVEM